MTEDNENLPICGGGGTEDDDNSKVGDNNKEQEQPLPLHGGGVTEDNEDLPLCGGGGTEDDENSKVGDNNKEQDQPLPLHGGGVTEDDEDLPLCDRGGTEDDDTLTEKSTMSSITRASKVNNISDLTDDFTVLKNEDSTNRLMIWNDKHVKLLDDGGLNCLWCKNIFKFWHATRALCHFLKLKGNHVAICKAIIPVSNLEHYHSMRKEGTDLTSSNRRAHEGQQEFIKFRQEAATS